MKEFIQLGFILFLSLGYSDAFIDRIPIFTKKPRTKPTIKPKTEQRKESTVDSNYIPPEILNKLRRVNSVQDLIREFKLKGITISGRGQPGRGLEQMVTVTKEGLQRNIPFAGDETRCTPRKQVEALPRSVGLASLLYPSCVMVKRCGGCCLQTNNVKCMPSKTSTRTLGVIEIFYGGGYKMRNFDIVDHTACVCSCSLTPQDCGSRTLDKDVCQCTCKKKPQLCESKKQWSTKQCKCICANREACPANRIWDEETCGCRCSSRECPNNKLRDRNTCLCTIDKSRSALGIDFKENPWWKIH